MMSKKIILLTKYCHLLTRIVKLPLLKLLLQCFDIVIYFIKIRCFLSKISSNSLSSYQPIENRSTRRDVALTGHEHLVSS